ncbi:unnamed protein product, partial [Rotaria magnacalcarata]
MSSTTSQKFRDFTTSNLEQSGITKAYELLGIYLTLLKNKEYFELWIRDNAGANRHQAKQCADS